MNEETNMGLDETLKMLTEMSFDTSSNTFESHNLQHSKDSEPDVCCLDTHEIYLMQRHVSFLSMSLLYMSKDLENRIEKLQEKWNDCQADKVLSALKENAKKIHDLSLDLGLSEEKLQTINSIFQKWEQSKM